MVESNYPNQNFNFKKALICPLGSFSVEKCFEKMIGQLMSSRSEMSIGITIVITGGVLAVVSDLKYPACNKNTHWKTWMGI